MSFFDDDPFEDFVNQFFGNNPNYRQRTNEVITGEQDERTIDFIETDKETFLVFELPGYRKEDVHVEINKTEIKIIAKRKISESVADYLAHKLSKGVEISKPLPKNLAKKKHEINFNNGILEVRFKKWLKKKKN